MRYIIFGNGDISDYGCISPYLHDGGFKVICCDGGIRHTHHLKITPDIIIGDFDSADKEILNYFINKDVSIQKYQTEKDDTDMTIAVEYAISQKAGNIVMFGATGTRLDHSLSNIYLLLKAERNNIPAYIVDAHNTIQIVSNKKIFYGKKGDILSLIPIDDTVTGVTTENMYYPLNNTTLYIDASRGISNVFIEDTAFVSVKSGRLLAVQAKD